MDVEMITVVEVAVAVAGLIEEEVKTTDILRNVTMIKHEKNNDQGRDNTNKGRDKRNVRCYNCSNFGHYAWECTKQPEPEANLNQVDNRGPALMMASVEMNEEKNLLNEDKVHPKLYANDSHNDSIWYLDNGASNHMTGIETHFTKLDKKVMGLVRFGDGSNVAIVEKGSVVF
jgi:hypothetical protein